MQLALLELIATTLRVSVIDSYNIKVSCCCAAAVVAWVKCAPKYRWKNNNNHFVQHTPAVFNEMKLDNHVIHRLNVITRRLVVCPPHSCNLPIHLAEMAW